MVKLDKFLPNRENRLMFPGCVAFAIAAVGVALVFTSQWLSLPWLGPVAFVITAIGVLSGFTYVLTGFIFVPYTWWKAYRSRPKDTQTARDREWKP